MRKILSEIRLMDTHSGGLACADVVGETGDVTGVTHEDGGSDLLLRRRRDRDGSTRETLVGVTSATVGVIHDLTTLLMLCLDLCPTSNPDRHVPGSNQLGQGRCWDTSC